MAAEQASGLWEVLGIIVDALLVAGLGVVGRLVHVVWHNKPDRQELYEMREQMTEKITRAYEQRDEATLVALKEGLAGIRSEMLRLHSENREDRQLDREDRRETNRKLDDVLGRLAVREPGH